MGGGWYIEKDREYVKKRGGGEEEEEEEEEEKEERVGSRKGRMEKRMGRK